MTLTLSENTWLKWSLGAALLVALVFCWAYLAGGIFLVAFERPFEDSTPIALYQYWYYYGGEKVVQRWLWISGVVAFLLVCAPLVLIFAPAKRSLFGDARFAKWHDIKRAGLAGAMGIIVGLYRGNYLLFGGSQHVIMSAPTRGGKGVAIAVPNLLNWADSVLTVDVKGENHAITSKFRERHGQPCFFFNPTSTEYKTHRYNPLAYISDDPTFAIDDIQKIGNILFPDKPGVEPIWTATPRTLFLGIVMMLRETPGKLVSLGQVLRETLFEGDGASYFAKIINDRAKAGAPLSGECVRALNTYISITAENTRTGVMTSFRARLDLWMNPLIDAATSGNDFDLREVRKQRMSIYVGVPPNNLERLEPLLNLFFQQFIELNTEVLPENDPSLKYQCLILADEFAALGKVRSLAKGIAYIAGYGLRLLPIVQSPAQLVEIYGKEAAENFTANHACQIVFAPKKTEVNIAKQISEWLGYQTVKGKSESKGTSLFAKKTESQSDQRRALMLPQEITDLGAKRELIVVENCPPILARKIRYYEDRTFMDRLKSVSPSLRALGRRFPKEKEFKKIIAAGELAADVPIIDMAAHRRLVNGEAAPQTVTAPPGRTGGKVVIERPVTAADVPNLAGLSLSSFAVDFSGVEKPKPGELDEAALRAYADELCRKAGIQV